MRKSLMFVAIAAFGSAPAHAIGLEDLAKVVLGGNSVLKKSETKCGSTAALSTKDSLTMEVAREAAKKVLTPAQFLALDTASEAEATTAASIPSFCKETVANKPSLLKTISKAGKKLVTARVLGGL